MLLTIFVFVSNICADALIVGGTGAADSDSCGPTAKPCQTLKQAIKNLKTNIYIAIAPGKNYTTDQIAAEINQSVYIYAYGAESTSYQSGGGGSYYSSYQSRAIPDYLVGIKQTKTCFTVSGTLVSAHIMNLVTTVTADSQYLTSSSTGAITLEEILVHGSAAVTHSSSLISITAGSLYMEECTLYRFTLANSPLISVNKTVGLFVDELLARYITRNTGDGSVFSLTVDALSPSLADIQFEHCVCKNGNGGAIAMTLSDAAGTVGNLNDIGFSHCSASGSGGAIYILSHRASTVTIDSIDVDDPCSAGGDGGIIYLETDKATEFVIQYTDIYSWTPETELGVAGKDGGIVAAVFKGSGGHLKLRNCSLPSGHAAGNGGVVSVVGESAHATTSLLVFSEGCSIRYGTASGNGGGISYIQKGKGGMQIEEALYSSNWCYISSCSAKGYGGGMYVEIKGDYELNISAMSTSSNTAPTGPQMYLSTDQTQLKTSSIWRWNVDNSIDSDEDIPYSTELPNSFVVAGGSPMDQIGVVSITGTDLTGEQKCPSTCKTISAFYTSSQPYTEYPVDRFQYASEKTYDAEGSNILVQNSAVIAGAGSNMKSILTLSEGTRYTTYSTVLFKYLGFKVLTETKAPTEKSFYVRSGSLAFLQCAFTTEKQSTQLTSELIALEGSLYIVHSTFSGFTLFKLPLIYSTYSRTNVYLYFSNFTNIETKTQSDTSGGSVLSMEDGNSFRCIGTSFTSCKSFSNGGVIWLRYVSATLGTSSPEKYTEDTTVKFVSCHSSDKGGAIYIDRTTSYSSSQFIYPYQVTFTSTNASTSGNYIYVLVSSSYFSYYSTYKYWSPLEPTAEKQFIVAPNPASDSPADLFKHYARTITVSSKGNTADECGATTPCLTLNAAINSAYKPKEIQIAAGDTITDTTNYIYLYEPLTIAGNEANPPVLSCALNAIYYGDSFITCYEDLTFQYLNFSLTATGSLSKTLIAHYSYQIPSTLTLNTLNIFSTAASSFYCSSIISSLGPVVIDKCTFANITLVSSPLLDLDETAVCSGCTFSNIVRQYLSGAVIALELEEDSDITITDSKFDQCKCENGYGGAMIVNASEDGGKLTMSGVTFSKCEAHLLPTALATWWSLYYVDPDRYYYSNGRPATEQTEKDVGRGGGLYVSVDSIPSFSFNDMSFTQCNATYGAQMLAATADEGLEAVVYSKDLWDGLVSEGSDDSGMVLAVVPQSDNSGGTASADFKPLSQKKASEVIHSTDKKKGIPVIIIVVVVVIVVIVVVAIIVVLVLRSKQLACFAQKIGVADEDQSQTEMTEKNQTTVDVTPDADKQPADS